MKQNDIARSMAERSPIGERPPIKPVDVYARPEQKPESGASKPPPAQPDIQDYAQRYRREEDTKRVVSIKMQPERRAQIKREAQDTGLFEWQVIDIALELYFREKRR
jgi:hypothetical protein